MKRRNGFVPGEVDGLERRALLSRMPGVGGSAITGGLYPGGRVLNRGHQSVAAQVNQAFDLFQSDYGQARSTYFSSISTNANDAAARDAFTLYTRGRVSLLAQQVVGSYLGAPANRMSEKGSRPVPVQNVVSRHLINPQGKDPQGSLARALLDAMPPAGTSASTASLYTLSQDNAIEAARVAVLNSVSIARIASQSGKSQKK